MLALCGNLSIVAAKVNDTIPLRQQREAPLASLTAEVRSPVS
jgi:hypothetical protein